MSISVIQASRADAPPQSTLPDLIAKQVALTPASVAILCGDRTLTYRELDIAANRLARDLLQRGLAPHTRIAVLVDRSVELPVALLGILKAGSAYVPLDPAYPFNRLAHVLNTAHPAAIVSKSNLIDSKSIQAMTAQSPAIVLLDTDRSASVSVDNRSAIWINAAIPDKVAYVIYTSGSTGVPKGVQVPHSAVTNFLCSMSKRPGLSAADTLLAVTTISFDIAVLELFLPLIVGAKIVLAQEQDVMDGSALVELLQRHKVTVLQATPVTWRMLIDAGWRGRPQMKMLCGGEAMSRRLADELLVRGGELWNMYGPTETTVWSSVLRVMPGEETVPLGPPIDNTSFHVLDDRLQPVATGEPGELFIGGAGVALGYVDLPELTAQKFLPDPLSTRAQARMYRTGDIVRACSYRALACYEFLGRSDSQVKIRGYRIELGEIEATLLRLPAVVQAVAIVGGESADAAIWAYVVLQSGATSLAAELQTEMRILFNKFLPSYMHPAAITALASFPKTPNGKIDRKALPAPMGLVIGAAQSTDLPEAHAAAKFRRNIEQRLMEIWSSLLGLRDIDATANFFSLGGQSLLAAQLLDRIESEFGVRLTLASLFGAPTVAEQAKLLREWDGRHYDFRQMVRLRASGSKPPLIAIHNTGVYCYHLAQLLGPEQPLIALQMFDPSRRAALPTTLEEIAAEYVHLIREVQPSGPYQLIGWCVGGVLAYETARQLRAEKDEVAFLGMIDSWAPGHLRRLPKSRAWLTDRSYRLQLIWTDWIKTRSGQQSLTDFLRNRVVLRKLFRLAANPSALPREKLFADRHLSGEHYDLWLASYLEAVAERYTPHRYDGKILLLRSSREPSGWFLDPLMGWREFVPSGIDTAILDGDHFTVFRGVGLRQMANVLNAALSA